VQRQREPALGLRAERGQDGPLALAAGPQLGQSGGEVPRVPPADPRPAPDDLDRVAP
jgi:hypothetical protein